MLGGCSSTLFGGQQVSWDSTQFPRGAEMGIPKLASTSDLPCFMT